MTKRRVCLVSPGHIASNPRLVKEADALDDAGFEVRVVAGDYMKEVRPLDETILSTAAWECVRVNYGSKARHVGSTILQRSARRLLPRVPRLSIATWAHSKISHRLAETAAARPADLFIAHNLAALPAAAIAARRQGARLGFDAEDFHTGELIETPENSVELRARLMIEKMLLPQCQHLTAAAPMIAGAYAERYGVRMHPILNVFPKREAPESHERSDGDRTGNEPSLYWFSQTIGAGRGLEQIVRAMGRMQTRTRLHLRGLLAAGYREKLKRIANEAGVEDRIHFLPVAPPAEMARLAACHDVGLALELNDPPHRALCLTNKIFVYLLAGIPMLLSDTPAQRQLGRELGEVASVVRLEDTEMIAKTLDCLVSNSERTRALRCRAWQLGQERYNWETEQKGFIRLIEEALT